MDTLMDLNQALKDYSGPYDAEYYDFNEHAEAAHLFAAEVESLRAKEARVRVWAEDRQVCAVHGDYMAGYQGARRDVLRALDGENK